MAITSHEALACQVFVSATVEHVPFSILVLLIVLGVPLLLVQLILDLRVKVSRVLFELYRDGMHAKKQKTATTAVTVAFTSLSNTFVDWETAESRLCLLFCLMRYLICWWWWWYCWWWWWYCCCYYHINSSLESIKSPWPQDGFNAPLPQKGTEMFFQIKERTNSRYSSPAHFMWDNSCLKELTKKNILWSEPIDKMHLR